MKSSIKITYNKNTKNKYDWRVEQNGIEFFTKTYSPQINKLQHYMGHALAKVAQDAINNEIENNPDFKWNTFADYKAWLSSPQLREKAVTYFNEHESEWSQNPNKGW